MYDLTNAWQNFHEIHIWNMKHMTIASSNVMGSGPKSRHWQNAKYLTLDLIQNNFRIKKINEYNNIIFESCFCIIRLVFDVRWIIKMVAKSKSSQICRLLRFERNFQRIQTNRSTIWGNRKRKRIPVILNGKLCLYLWYACTIYKRNYSWAKLSRLTKQLKDVCEFENFNAMQLKS